MNLHLPFCCSLLLAALCGQRPGEAPPPEDPAAKVLGELREQFQREGVELDAKALTVAIPAVVNQPQDPIEYLLIHRKGKRHEAVFWTRTKPSVLNAALLLLGLEPGKNATYVEKDPPPSLEEIEAGADPIVVTPPSGMALWMTVRWRDGDGKPVEHCVEDLLLDLRTQKPIVDCSWIFLGGRMAALYRGEPEVFVADFEGNLISTCYKAPENHLATIVHADARDDDNWWTTPLLPEPETEVTFVFHRRETKLHRERQARLRREREAAAGAGAPPVQEPPK
ncbi:MAG: hypothetical protein KF830_15565 [Planctomycetes bacterium]|nr:hypothetical protein [Planctomycetota bacterium]